VASRLRPANDDTAAIGWHSLGVPFALLAVAGLFAPFICQLLRIAGTPREVIAFAQTTTVYLTAAWLMIIGSVLIGEFIIGAERLAFRSLDGQLIRLGSRLVGIVAAVGCLIKGADELGFPAYSVLAGLGVGGLAVALAARDSLANLLGSLVIMFEKPFRVGHHIRLSGTEGVVEDVGFRSTRIRTPDSSLISIPNNSVVNMTVENVSIRPVRRQRFFVGLTYDTPRETMEAMVAGIRQIILDHPLTDKKNLQVSFNAFNDSSLDILVLFNLNVSDYASELAGRQEVLLQIMALAEDHDVSFAFPSRTLYLEGESSKVEAAKTVRLPFAAS
jgi:MscS family membrane protein